MVSQNPPQFRSHFPNVDEATAATALQSWSSLSPDEQNTRVAELIHQEGLRIPLITEATVEGVAYGPDDKSAFIRGVSIGAIVLESVGAIPTVSGLAVLAAGTTYSNLLDPSRRKEPADNRTSGLWQAIRRANRGYAGVVDRFAATDTDYAIKPLRRGAAKIFVVTNEQYALGFQNRTIRERQIEAIKPTGLLDNFNEDQGLETLHDLTRNDWPWHNILLRHPNAYMPIEGLLKNLNANPSDENHFSSYVLGYTLALGLMERQGVFRHVYENAALACRKMLDHDARRQDADSVQSQKREELRSMSGAFTAVIDHAQAHLDDDSSMERLWDGAAAAFSLVLAQKTFENAERMGTRNRYN